MTRVQNFISEKLSKLFFFAKFQIPRLYPKLNSVNPIEPCRYRKLWKMSTSLNLTCKDRRWFSRVWPARLCRHPPPLGQINSYGLRIALLSASQLLRTPSFRLTSKYPPCIMPSFARYAKLKFIIFSQISGIWMKRNLTRSVQIGNKIHRHTDFLCTT